MKGALRLLQFSDFGDGEFMDRGGNMMGSRKTIMNRSCDTRTFFLISELSSRHLGFGRRLGRTPSCFHGLEDDLLEFLEIEGLRHDPIDAILA